MDQKKKLLLFPYLVISAGVMLVYYVFCSYIYQQQGEAKIDEEIVNFWIPYSALDSHFNLAETKNKVATL